jgi:hypothetical protein
MGDCRLCSLVFCHDHSAQILEFHDRLVRSAHVGRYEMGVGKSGSIELPRQMFTRCHKKQKFFSASIGGHETFPKNSHKPVHD